MRRHRKCQCHCECQRQGHEHDLGGGRMVHLMLLGYSSESNHCEAVTLVARSGSTNGMMRRSKACWTWRYSLVQRSARDWGSVVVVPPGTLTAAPGCGPGRKNLNVSGSPPKAMQR